MGAAGKKLGLRLFLEGVEVPVIAAQVSCTINAPATASIQVVPGDGVLELRARTMVHLFFWDSTHDKDTPFDVSDPVAVANHLGVSVDEARRVIVEEPERLSVQAEELRGYKLLFCGEVIGVSLTKTPVGRQAVLQCSDFSTYWDTTYQFFISYGPNGNFLGTSARVWAGGDSMFDDIGRGHVSVMNDYLNNTPKTPGLQNVKGLMGGLISLLEAMGGVPRHTHGVNDFFTIGELKNHILQQIVCEQNDDTAKRLFSSKAFHEWLNRGMSSLGQLTTFRDMMKLLFKYVYYESVPNPCAMYVPQDPGEVHKNKKSVTTGNDLTPKQRELIEDSISKAQEGTTATLGYDDESAAEFIVKNMGFFQVLTKSATEGAVYQRRVTRLKEQLDADRISREQYQTQLEEAKRQAELDQAKIDIVNSKFVPLRVKSHINRAVSTCMVILSAKDRRSLSNKGDFEYRAEQNRRWGTVVTELRKAIRSANRYKTREVRVRKGAELDHLHTQIFRPDCFFAAPPKCNVIFPDQYTQFSFSRNFLQEVTRLRLAVDWVFGINRGILQTDVHFAPATKDIKALARRQGNNSLRALLPWEKYSGILPKFETIHEINYIAARGERRLGLKRKSIRGSARAFSQRAANFNYMKYRFAARSCEVAMKFNPNMVCGFPALLIERPFIVNPHSAEDRDRLNAALQKTNQGNEQKIALDDASDHIRALAREYGAPTQYLGMVASLSHLLGQEGGSTSINLTHARTHRVTEDDFLNIFSKELTREVETKVVHTVLDAEDVIKRGDWKSLRTLKNVTPQNILQQVTELEEAQNLQQTPFEEEGLLRPDSTPDVSGIDPLAGFAGLLQMPPPERETRLVVDSGQIVNGKRRVTLRGKVKQGVIPGSNQPVVVPVAEGRLKIGDRGPQGGRIVGIQLFTDGVVMALGDELNKRHTRTIQWTEEVYVDEFGNIQDPFIRDEDRNPIGSRHDPNFTLLKKKRVGRFERSEKVFLWRRVAIYEEVPNRRGRLVKQIPVEEGMRPPWFSPLYSNWFIGDQIYQPFFGCGSVVDQSLFTTDDGTAVFGTGRQEQQAILDELKDANGDHKKILQILEDAKAKDISDVPDVESAADALAYLYGEVRRLNMDVHKFVDDYTRRPIASMEDIFGTLDLEYEVNGNQLTLVRGKPGFHSTAVAPYGELLGLLDNPDLELPRLKKGRGKKEPVSKELDPRPGRRERVMAYLREINGVRSDGSVAGGAGSLGVGVRG